MKKRGAVAPLSHRLDTLSRVEKPKHDWGCESAAHVRKTEASRHECVGGMRIHGVELRRLCAPEDRVWHVLTSQRASA